MSQGTIEHTGDPLDVAIDGKGFLVVQTPRGERYTRNGALQINATGELVTSDGYQVLGDGGPIVAPADRPRRRRSAATARSACAKATAHVEFHARQTAAGHLRQSAAAAERTAPAPSRRRPASQPQPDTDASRIMQGALEKSNVRGVVEMSRMIEITRSYTQIATMLQQQNDLRTDGDRQARRSSELTLKGD